MPKIDDAGQSALDKYVQTILLSVITAVLIGSGTLLMMTYREIGVMQYQLRSLDAKTSSFISKDQVGEMFKRRDVVLEDHHRRISQLERP